MNPILRTVLTVTMVAAFFGSIYFSWLGKRTDLGLLCMAIFVALFLIAVQFTPNTGGKK